MAEKANSNNKRECIVSPLDLHSADIPRFGCCMYEPPIGHKTEAKWSLLRSYLRSNAKRTTFCHFPSGAATVAVKHQIHRPHRCKWPACQNSSLL